MVHRAIRFYFAVILLLATSLFFDTPDKVLATAAAVLPCSAAVLP